MYQASNGITAITVSDDEAREVFVRTDPRQRTGSIEGGFAVYPVGEQGGLITCAATAYRPLAAHTDPDLQRAGYAQHGI